MTHLSTYPAIRLFAGYAASGLGNLNPEAQDPGRSNAVYFGTYLLSAHGLPVQEKAGYDNE
ncbi:hypothetical protein AA102526_1076 [Asaia lannensis NBRC 102526]|nr:hypothetical protein AA102526_1076 [Asaia lannensis NBRC 102526]